jgi:WXG100 family type VII secretion target
MAMFQAGAPQLMQAGQEMVDTKEQLMNQGQQLASAVEAVNWKGTAQVAFNNLMSKFAQDLTQMNESLNNIADQVTASAKAYEAQNAQAQQDITGIMSALDG